MKLSPPCHVWWHLARGPLLINGGFRLTAKQPPHPGNLRRVVALERKSTHFMSIIPAGVDPEKWAESATNVPLAMRPTRLELLKNRRDELNRELMSLHLQISTAEAGSAPEHKCLLNGKEIVTRGPCFGAILRTFLTADQAPHHSLFFENTGNAPDILINDSDPIPHGARVYSCPGGMFGG